MSKGSLQILSTYPPLLGKSTKLGSDAVAKVIEKRSLLARLRRDRKKYDTKLDKALHTGSIADIAAIQLDLGTAEGRIDELQKAIQHEENRLGFTGRAKLKDYKDSEYLQLRVNATVLRERIVARMVEHRFEMSKFDRLARYERMGRCICHVSCYVYLTEILSKS